MNDLSITLKILRESRNISMEELSKKAGVSRGIIGEIERGKTASSIKTLEKLAVALELTKEENERLFSSYMPSGLSVVKSNIKILENEEFITIPVKAKASAGNGYINLESCLYEMKIRKNGFHRDCYLIEVVGNSMEPQLNDGCFVIVDPKQLEYIKNKIYVLKYNEETFIKKVEIETNTEMMILKSINPKYENIYVVKKDIENIKILGRAVSFFYEGLL